MLKETVGMDAKRRPKAKRGNAKASPRVRRANGASNEQDAVVDQGKGKADNGQEAVKAGRALMDYTPLLELIAETGNLSKSCKELGVAKSAFLERCGSDENLADQYARAREMGLDAEADRAIQEALEATDAGLGRLALDARKWYLSKLLPKKYGDASLLKLAGADGKGPVETALTVVFKKSADDSAG